MKNPPFLGKGVGRQDVARCSYRRADEAAVSRPHADCDAGQARGARPCRYEGSDAPRLAARDRHPQHGAGGPSTEATSPQLERRRPVGRSVRSLLRRGPMLHQASPHAFHICDISVVNEHLNKIWGRWVVCDPASKPPMRLGGRAGQGP